MRQQLQFNIFMDEFRQRINNCLNNALPPSIQSPNELHEAMRYAVLGGGKRIRSLLAYATGISLNIDLKCVDKIAVSLELVHAYSLIHDDLPSMDNAELRHGQLTCHKKFNEALAILAGDALQSLAFEILSAKIENLSTDNQISLINILSHAIGTVGMAGGQTLDLAAEKQQITLDQLANIHQLKTGALIMASIKMPAIISNCAEQPMNDLIKFAQNIGIAFQIQDDILDYVSSTEVLGKTQGADIINQKMTYVTLLGLDIAKEYADKHYQTAIYHLKQCPFDTTLLAELAEYVVKRKY